MIRNSMMVELFLCVFPVTVLWFLWGWVLTAIGCLLMFEKGQLGAGIYMTTVSVGGAFGLVSLWVLCIQFADANRVPDETRKIWVVGLYCGIGATACLVAVPFPAPIGHVPWVAVICLLALIPAMHILVLRYKEATSNQAMEFDA